MNTAVMGALPFLAGLVAAVDTFSLEIMADSCQYFNWRRYPNSVSYRQGEKIVCENCETLAINARL